MMTAEDCKVRWEVEWVESTEIDELIAKGDYDKDERMMASAEATHCRPFPRQSEARAFALSVLPRDEFGSVRIDKQVANTWNPHDGGPSITDWACVGEPEFIESEGGAA